jgi:hypothetical protein
VQDPESALVFATSGRGATLVTVNGRELVRNGQLTVNIDQSIATMLAAAEDLRRFPKTVSQSTS